MALYGLCLQANESSQIEHDKDPRLWFAGLCCPRSSAQTLHGADETAPGTTIRFIQRDIALPIMEAPCRRASSSFRRS